MTSLSLGTGDIRAIETPALLLDLDVVERNLERMAARAKQLGVQLRPHAKTHKCPELGKRQLAHGAVGLTVATLAEAEAFADAGVQDLTWAFPIDPTHIVHAQRIAARPQVTLRVVTDDLETAQALGGSGLHVWLKVDCGTHRAGVDPTSPYAIRVARELAREDGLVFDGILTHSGHAYKTVNRAEAAAVAEEERLVMVQFAQRLGVAGIAARAISVGSTPAMAAAADLTGVTEARPGNYVFYDRTMVLIGCCEPQDVGVTVLASVVSHQPGGDHLVIDAGALALSKDPGPTHIDDLAPSFGDIRGFHALHVASLSQEHGVVRGSRRALRELKVGDRIEIVPNHSCLTVACFDDYHVMRDGKEIDRWAIKRER